MIPIQPGNLGPACTRESGDELREFTLDFFLRRGLGAVPIRLRRENKGNVDARVFPGSYRCFRKTYRLFLHPVGLRRVETDELPPKLHDVASLGLQIEACKG